MTFKKVTLVTGHDEKGNENFYYDVDGIWFNDFEVRLQSEYLRTKIFPTVIIARFGDVELSGDQWRDLQCPIRMTQEQLDAVLANQPAAVTAYEAEFVDAWSDPRTPEEKAADEFAQEVEYTRLKDWDVTPTPNMPIIDFGSIDEIPF